MLILGNWDIKKSIQNSQILQNIDLQQQALSLLQNKLESDSDSQPTEENGLLIQLNSSHTHTLHDIIIDTFHS